MEVPWTSEEDTILMQVVAQLKDTSNWSEIAYSHYKSLLRDESTKYKTPPRGALDCRQRWSVLQGVVQQPLKAEVIK